MKTNEVLEFRKGTDTRNGEDLNIYSIKDQLSKDDYIKLNQTLKGQGCYYSKFVKGFICKTELPEDLDVAETSQTTKKTANVTYKKNLLDYISIEDYKSFLANYAEANYNFSWAYRVGSYVSMEDVIAQYQKELFDNLNYSMKYNSFGELSDIREAIMHKSLGHSQESFKANYQTYYLAIWDKLPIIEGLKQTNEAYTAMWGYDQTNVDIAFKLNKKVWGLDAFRQTDNEYYLVRLKDDRFHDKNGVRYFSRDSRPLETFKQDASQTGQYG
jgi:hypothetical protein